MADGNTPIDLHDDSSEERATSPDTNPTFQEIATRHLTRRQMLGGTLAVAGAGFLAPAPAHAFGRRFRPRRNAPLIGFEPLTIEDAVAEGGKTVTIAPEYEYQVLIPWGTPINPRSGIQEYTGDPSTRPTAFEQEQMIGIGHDGMFFYPRNLPAILRIEQRLGRRIRPALRNRILSSRSGFLCINHEFGTNPHVLGKSFPESLEDVRLSQAAHGVSVVSIRQRGRNGEWVVSPNNDSRRITVNSEVAFSGPAAHSALLVNAAGNTAAGTVNNCGSGETPWGTYLTCEENFNGYFGSESGGIGGFDPLQDQAYARYGFSTDGFGYGWHVFDERFDLANPLFANESNRFGWIVEIDPYDGTSKPVKRTALGRFKHEAAAVKELADGRVAVYMGDDQRGDYCYKYESRLPWRKAIARGLSPLDDGKLYVARFIPSASGNEDNGHGEWVELTCDNPDIAAAGLVTQDLVLVYARIAADAVGATRMDRPEWSTLGINGEIYWTLTNNDRKDRDPPQGELSEVNPIFANTDGYIIKTEDTSATTFTWNMFLISRNTRAENPGDDPRDLPYAAYTPPADGGANVFTDPDCAWADPFGRLFIGTDGGQPAGLQDQLVVIDTNTGEYKRLLMGVNSDEITGCIATPDYRTLFANTQHPGNGDPTRTNFPAADDGVTIPRDCTLVVTKKNGGIVGS